MRLVNLSKQADKFLNTLPAKQYKQLARDIFRLAKQPQQQDTAKLKGHNHFFRKDSGEYRIIYRFDATILYVAIVNKRNDDKVYKTFLRKLERVVTLLTESEKHGDLDQKGFNLRRMAYAI